METRFVRADLIEVYKIFNGLDSLNSGRYFVQDEGVTRGHSFKHFKKMSGCWKVLEGVGRFGNRVFNEWNLLDLPGFTR